MTERSTEVLATLQGPAGDLEARWREPPAELAPRAVAVLCHPHPLHGGTLHNKTLFRIARRLAEELRFAVLRFNFRGAGSSAGEHDGGSGEIEDALAAIDAASQRYGKLPLVVIGYSFGAAVGLRAGVADERVARLVALGIPLRARWDLDFMGATRKPRLFVQGEHDEFGPASELYAFVEELAGETEVQIIPGADHLFTGREDEAVAAVIEYIRAHC